MKARAQRARRPPATPPRVDFPSRRDIDCCRPSASARDNFGYFDDVDDIDDIDAIDYFEDLHRFGNARNLGYFDRRFRAESY